MENETKLVKKLGLILFTNENFAYVRRVAQTLKEESHFAGEKAEVSPGISGGMA